MTMRAGRLITWALATMLAAGTFASGAAAQSNMTFRAVPPESVASATEAAKADARRMREEARRELASAKIRVRDGVKVSGGSAGPGIRIDDTLFVSDVQGHPVGNLPDSMGEPKAPRPPRSTTGEIMRFGSDITVDEGQEVQGDVVSVGGDVRVEGRVTGSVTAMGGDVSLGSDARVDGDVVCMGGTLREEPGATVGGQRVTAAPKMPGGKLFLPMMAAVGTGFEVATQLFKILFWMALSWLIVKLAPGRTQEALETIRREAGTSFLIGLGVWALIIPSVIALALVIALLCITIIGIPLAAAVVVGYVAFFIVAAIWGSIVGFTLLGGELHKRLKGTAATLVQCAIWGVVAVFSLRVVGSLFHLVPLFGFMGGLMKVVAGALLALLATLGAGALVRSEYLRRTVQDWWHRTRSSKSGPKRDDVPPPPAAADIPPSPPPPPPPAPPSDPASFAPPPPTTPWNQ
ncbi:MAG: polymer-forming cytoskeletal protein [Candidatus Eisenbacteria bacterium]